MRLLSLLALFAALGAFGLAVAGMAQRLTEAGSDAFVPPVPSGVAQASFVPPPALERGWPAVFGALPPAPTPEPEIAAAPEPEPEIRYDYLLTGLVADRYAAWALVSLGGLQQVVRVGDTLEGGEIVRRIDHQGVWIEWQGQPQLIPVNKQDLSFMARDLVPPGDVTPEVRDEVSVVLERLDPEGLTEVFEGAGTLVLSTGEDGTQSLDVVWIRQGELYDRIGLRTGDKILRINGETVENSDLLAYVPDAITNGGTIALEILRDGNRRLIKVNLGQG